MKTTLLQCVSQPHSQTLKITFPPRVISTNVDQLRAELDDYLSSATAKIEKWDKLELDFGKTDFVDSLGLNFVFDIVKLAEGKNANIVAWVTSRSVRLIFFTVRLDRRMDIRLMEIPPQTK